MYCVGEKGRRPCRGRDVVPDVRGDWDRGMVSVDADPPKGVGGTPSTASVAVFIPLAIPYGPPMMHKLNEAD